MPRVTAANFVWLIAYLAMVVCVSFALLRYRDVATNRYATEQAGAQWQEWRRGAAELGKSGPVKRRMPKAVEPPALLLMRDYFGSCLAISLLLSSALFLWFMVSLRGALRRPAKCFTPDEDLAESFPTRE